MNIRQHLAVFMAWNARRRFRRELERAERQRNANMRAIHLRRERHQQHSHIMGDLKQATNRSLAAWVGRDWEAR